MLSDLNSETVVVLGYVAMNIIKIVISAEDFLGAQVLKIDP